jgi:hypothetical protein
MDISDNPILRHLLEQSQRHNQQVALLDREVKAYVVRDIPVPPWFNHRQGGVGCEGCGAEPVWEVLVHQVGDCNADDLDADGNFVWRGCDRCYRDWQHELRVILDHRLRRYLPVPCPSCQRPIAQATDILLKVRRL